MVIDTMAKKGAGAGWGWLMAVGIVSAALGVAALIWPFPATFAATLVVGTLLMTIGITTIAAGALGRGHGRETYLILSGILSFIIGLSIASFPLSGAVTLTVLVAVWLGVRGVLELIAAARRKRARGLMLALGAINVILAVLIFATMPGSALTLPGTLLGISLLLGGFGEIRAASAHRAGAPAFSL
ncbi:HdeD family acid-resistance protein [Sphingomonas bacterium]|uniref:HdeD family acid-resistance protein n=1 Tax=Sphingomonas bacterium TaxID=1895847 RepID=UPI001576927C|nr:DUF308 domain-containing protein [Sphingomonas bacterium]